MFHEMRRIDRKLTNEEAEELLLAGEYGVLATVGEDGYPYGVPVNYAYADDTIYFHGAKNVGHKYENILHNPKVCFTVVGKTEVLPEQFSTKYESVVVLGTAKPAADKRRALQLLVEKYSPDFMEKGQTYIEHDIDTVGVYEIVIEHITGKGRR